MDSIELVKPSQKFLASYLETLKEAEMFDPTYSQCFCYTRSDIFTDFNNYEKGINLPENYVPASYFWLVRGNDFIGEISIRHRLTPALEKYGGHIGYKIRYSEWNKGYGTKMLILALIEAKKMGLDRVLITCHSNNYASKRVIEKNGGILNSKIYNIIEGRMIFTLRYWIDLSNK